MAPIINLEYSSKEEFQQVSTNKKNRFSWLYYNTDGKISIPMGNNEQELKIGEITKLTDASIAYYERELMYLLFGYYNVPYETYKEMIKDLKYIMINYNGSTFYYNDKKICLPFITVLNGSNAQFDFVSNSKYTEPFLINLRYDIALAEGESPDRISKTSVVYFTNDEYKSYYDNLIKIQQNSSIEEYAKVHNINIKKPNY